MAKYIKSEKTNNEIKQLFLDLIKTKPIKTITVSEICSTLNINRSTFYRHYLDIYDLLEHIENDLSQKIDTLYESIINNHYASKKTMEIILQFILENKTILSTLILNNSGRLLWNTINDKIIELFKLKIFDNYPKAKFDNEHLNDVLVFLSNGYYAIYKNWIQNDCQEPIEPLADWLTNLSDTCIEQFIIK